MTLLGRQSNLWLDSRMNSEVLNDTAQGLWCWGQCIWNYGDKYGVYIMGRQTSLQFGTYPSLAQTQIIILNGTISFTLVVITQKLLRIRAPKISFKLVTLIILDFWVSMTIQQDPWLRKPGKNCPPPRLWQRCSAQPTPQCIARRSMASRSGGPRAELRRRHGWSKG